VPHSLSKPAPAEPRPDAKAATPKTILVAEDNHAVRVMTCTMLELEGYRVLAAANGAEALVLAERTTIDLLLTDIVMPGMNGKELSSRINTIRGPVPVVFFSGFTDETIVPNRVIAATDHYLRKPFSPEGLAKKIREALATVDG
jgi:CheY-like chemotaxis protein